MPELLLELLTEEIPARMQVRAADDLCRMVAAALEPLSAGAPQGFSGPRRIGLVMEVAARAETAAKEERGPRLSAPEAALTGFLKKHGVGREALTQAGDFWVLVKPGASIEAAALAAQALPDVLWNFPWPKSMRWGVSDFTWVRPLQRILCVLDAMVVPFSLKRGGDAAHGLASDNMTEGHRVHAPGAFAVRGWADFRNGLRARSVVVGAADRAAIIRDGVAALAEAEGLEVVPDAGLLAEVAGLVEWPVPLLGRIDTDYMDLPPEVLRTSMRVNQRYFALRTPDGRPAPRFALVANIEASDGGAALVAGNERVLRARLSDARFFWDQDLKTPLEALLPKLDGVVFHAKLGTQGQRASRIAGLAAFLAAELGTDIAAAKLAGQLAKADLVSGMVGEFPELQGVMGGYYARAVLGDVVATAIGTHYQPAGPADPLPTGPVAVVVALADKFDQLVGFFAIDERPTGSGDPFALRRAALGIIRLLREDGRRLALRPALGMAHSAVIQSLSTAGTVSTIPGDTVAEVLTFVLDRLRVQLRHEGGRFDIITAAIGDDDDIVRILARAGALRTLVESDIGAALLAAYKRAQNILRIEEKKDGPHNGPLEGKPGLPQEAALLAALEAIEPLVAVQLAAEDFSAAMATLATLRPPLDAFFEHVMVNDPDPALRKNRLRLLSRLKSAMDSVADLSKIEA